MTATAPRQDRARTPRGARGVGSLPRRSHRELQAAGSTTGRGPPLGTGFPGALARDRPRPRGRRDTAPAVGAPHRRWGARPGRRESTDQRAPRPPAPIVLTASMSADRVSVSPRRFGAGPIELVVQPTTLAAGPLETRPPARHRQQTAPINRGHARQGRHRTGRYLPSPETRSRRPPCGRPAAGRPRAIRQRASARTIRSCDRRAARARSRMAQAPRADAPGAVRGPVVADPRTTAAVKRAAHERAGSCRARVRRPHRRRRMDAVVAVRLPGAAGTVAVYASPPTGRAPTSCARSSPAAVYRARRGSPARR